MNKEVTLIVENIKCHGCANTISTGIGKFEEVEEVKVNVEASTVELTINGDEEILLKIKEKLARMGYPEAGNNSGIAKAKSYVSCAIGRINSN